MTDKTTTVACLLSRVLAALDEAGVLDTDVKRQVIQFRYPSELQTERWLQELGQPVTSETFNSVIDDVLKYSVKTNHPLFVNQLYGGTDPYGLAASWLIEALNTNQHTFEVAPVFTVIEMSLIEKLLQTVGYKEGDGIFTAGGSMATMYAMVLARFKKCPEVKKTGIYASAPLAVFISTDAHYSVMKAANWLGIGMDNVYQVKCDELGRMSALALEECITTALAAGKAPFFVNVTAGTTVLGAFDPFHSVADICHRYNLWFHVDACWGGALFFSKKYNSILDGAERSDSLAWNPHKMIGAPLQCSVILLKEKGLLHECNCASATYLFQQDKFYNTEFDSGDKSVQCGRKPDAFKLWLMWRMRGDEGFAALVDTAMDRSRYFLKKIADRQDFRLVLPSFQCTNVCFWYIPTCLQGQPETNEWWERLGKVAPLIKKCVVLNGSLMIGYQPLNHRKLPNFFRLVLSCHPARCESDLDKVISEIEAAGRDLEV